MRVFYGWWVLLGLFLIYMANNGILLNTLPLFYPELIKEFGWNEEEVTRPATLFFIIAAVLTPFVGALFDKFSTRLIMVVGIVALAAALVAFPQITSLGQLTAVYMVFALGLAGAGLVPNMLILTRWFRRYRGIAVGILLMSSSVGGALFPLLAKNTLVNQGWREAVMLVAIVGTVMMVASIVLLVRNRPEDKGLAPDGDALAPAQTDAPAPPAGMTLGQAARTPAFYLLMFATGGMWFCIVGVLNHQAIFLAQDLGVSNAVLPLVFSVFFWSAVIGKLLFGFLGDHFNKTLIMFISALNLGLGLLVLRNVDPGSTMALYGYAVTFGVGFSGAFAMIQLVIAEYFAGASFGKILGVFTMIDSIAGAMGIKYLGSLRVAQGSYIPALDQMIGLTLAVAAVVVVLWRLGAGRNTGAIASDTAAG